MKEMINSDINLKMLATTSFDHVINEIQRSGLNFQLQISPFSALISVKKSLIKDVSGKPLLPPKIKPDRSDFTSEQIEALVSKNIELEKELTLLRMKHEEVAKYADVKVEAASIASHEQELETEIDKLKDIIKARDGEILDLRIANKTSSEASGKLSKALGDARIKFEKEKTVLKKEHRAEVKTWRKDLGDANSMIIKLEK